MISERIDTNASPEPATSKARPKAAKKARAAKKSATKKALAKDTARENKKAEVIALMKRAKGATLLKASNKNDRLDARKLANTLPPNSGPGGRWFESTGPDQIPQRLTDYNRGRRVSNDRHQRGRCAAEPDHRHLRSPNRGCQRKTDREGRRHLSSGWKGPHASRSVANDAGNSINSTVGWTLYNAILSDAYTLDWS
jgi:hypothetical protein